MEASMSHTLTITRESDYLHAVVTGINSVEAVRAYLKEILQECIARNCSKVLIEERLEGPRLDTVPVYQIASEGSQRARGYLKAIAYVDINAHGDLMKFAENVAVNRGIPVAVFSSVREAREWLLRT
jgi:hypothetical protein